jgi:type I restriction-modification system DNA methylase subunit
MELNFSQLSLNETKTISTSKSELETKFDAWHQSLYKFGISGSKALHDIINVMFMFQINKLCKAGKLKIPTVQNCQPNTHEYRVFNGYMNEYLVSKEGMILLINTFNKIAKVDPILKSIYPNGLVLYCASSSEFNLLQLFSDIAQFVEAKNMKDYDPNGILYEKILNGYLSGKDNNLGQFFTPRIIVDKIIDEIYSEVKEISQTDQLNIIDPFMGTGGFLTRVYNRLKSNNVNCELNGRDLEYDTFKYGIMNVITATGDLKLDNFRCEDSIRKPTIWDNQYQGLKYNVILTNPPFGIKFKLEEIGLKQRIISQPGQVPTKQNFDHEQQYAKVQTTSGSFHALQLCMFLLKENGICAIVMPRGQEIIGCSRNHKNFIQVRQYLIEHFNLIKVLDCQKNSFEHTAVETTVLIFMHGRTSSVEFKNLKDSKILTVTLQQLKEKN